MDYYRENDDFYTTATGFLNEEGIWDVYYDENIEELKELFDDSYLIDEDFGVLLFKAKDYDDAQIKFAAWVENMLIPFMEKKRK